jgi:predicted nucleic acid-binding protein
VPPRLTPAEILRIIRDVLSACTVRRAGALLVTDHIRDFERFQPFCNLRLRRGSEYLAR